MLLRIYLRQLDLTKSSRSGPIMMASCYVKYLKQDLVLISKSWIWCESNKENKFAVIFHTFHRLLTSSSSRNVLVYQIEKDAEGWRMETMSRLVGHRRMVTCLDVQEDKIMTGSLDKTVRLWSASSTNNDCLTYLQDALLEGHFIKVKIQAEYLSMIFVWR